MLRRTVLGLALGAAAVAWTPQTARAADDFEPAETVSSAAIPNQFVHYRTGPKVATTPNGGAVAIWEDSATGATFRIRASERTATGPWSEPVTISTDGRHARDPELRTDAAGNATAVWMEELDAGEENDALHVATKPLGESWTEPAPLTDGDPIVEHSSLDVNANGDAVVAWSAGAATRARVKRQDDTGWSTAQQLSGASSLFPTAAMDPTGTAWVAYPEIADSSSLETRSLAPGQTSWSAPDTVAASGTRWYSETDIAFDANADAVLAFRHGPEFGGPEDDRLEVVYRDALDDAWSTPPQALCAGSVQCAAPDLDVDATGNAVLAFLRGPGNATVPHVATRPAGGEFGTAEAIGSATTSPPSAQMAGDATAVVAYTSASSMRAVNVPVGQTPDEPEPLADGDSASRAALALDANGRGFAVWRARTATNDLIRAARRPGSSTGGANVGPSASFTFSPAGPRPDQEVTLTSTSSDPDGHLTSWQWDLDGDGQTDDATGATVRTSYPTTGDKTVTLRVEDDGGEPATATRTIAVVPSGSPPASFVARPQPARAGESVTFTAATSTDPDAQIVRYDWDFDGDGRFDADTRTPDARFSYATAGTYTATLRTTDREGDASTGTGRVIVEPAATCQPIVLPAITLDGCWAKVGEHLYVSQGTVEVSGVQLIPGVGGVLVMVDVAAGVAKAVAPHVAALVSGGVLSLARAAAQDVMVGIRGLFLPGLVKARSLALEGLLEASAGVRGLRVALVGLPGTVGGALVRAVGPLHLFAKEALLTLEGRFGRFFNLPVTLKAQITRLASAPFVKGLADDIVQGAWRMVDFAFDRVDERTYDGGFGLVLPTPTLTQFTVSGRFVDGAPESLEVDTRRLPSPAQGMIFRRLTLGLKASPPSLSGRGTLETIAQYPPGNALLSIDGTLDVKNRSILLRAPDLRLAGFSMGQASAELHTNGRLTFGATAGIKTPVAEVEADLRGDLDAPTRTFDAEGNATLRIDGIGSLSGTGLVSSKGIAACGQIETRFGTARPGFAQPWTATFPTLFANSCDVGPYRVTVGAAQAGARGFSLPRGLPSASVSVRGADGPPRITLISPRGERVTSPQRGGTRRGRFVLVPNEGDRSTNVLIVKPPPGRWRIQGEKVRAVRVAEGLPAARVRASARVRRGTATLRWRLRRIAGQRVTFVEEADDARRRLRTTTAARGTLRFRPRPGARGRRIVALVEQNGMLRDRRVVARFRAEGAGVPAAPRAATWRPAPEGVAVTIAPRDRSAEHVVIVRRGDLEPLTEVVRAGARTVTIALPLGEATRVEVRALARRGARSRATVARRVPSRR